MITNEMIKLENGVKVPKLALGVWMIPEKETEAAVKSAIAMGYHHIDTAQEYDNEAGVGAGVRNCGVPREELFVTSKIAKIAKKYGVSIPQLCIRYDWQLGMIVLQKTANPDQQKENIAIDFVISDEDMKTLKNMERIESYGEFGFFPVYGGKLKGYSGKPGTEIVD